MEDNKVIPRQKYVVVYFKKGLRDNRVEQVEFEIRDQAIKFIEELKEQMMDYLLLEGFLTKNGKWYYILQNTGAYKMYQRINWVSAILVLMVVGLIYLYFKQRSLQ